MSQNAMYLLLAPSLVGFAFIITYAGYRCGEIHTAPAKPDQFRKDIQSLIDEFNDTDMKRYELIHAIAERLKRP